MYQHALCIYNILVRVYLATVIIYPFLTPRKDTFKGSRCTRQQNIKHRQTEDVEREFRSLPQLIISQPPSHWRIHIYLISTF